MDERRIDHFARLLAAGSPRRRVAGGLGALLLGGMAAPSPALAKCKKVGKTCDKHGDCCKGARCKKGKCRCKGSREECNGKCYKLEEDERHCGRCNNACAVGERCCGGECLDRACELQ